MSEKLFDAPPEFDPMVVPCMDCGEEVEASSFAVSMAVECSRICASKGWSPIKKREIARCHRCRKRFEREEEGRTAYAIRALDDLRSIVNASALSKWLQGQPSWFKERYQPEIAEALKKLGALSTRSDPEGMKVGRRS